MKAHSVEEVARLASLHAYDILDTAADPHFDAITRVAARVLGVPTALVSFIDDDRQWVKSGVGLLTNGMQTTREIAFCAQTISSPPELLLVEDAATDRRFRDHPSVKGPGGIRFYAGVPLLDDSGHALGAFCVVDTVPRQVSATEVEILRDLAAAASSALELHRSLATLKASEDHRTAAIEQNPQIPWTASPEGHILEVSPGLIVTLAAMHEETLHGSDWTTLIHPDDLPETKRRREHALKAGQPYDIEHRMRSADGRWRWFRSYAAPRYDRDGKVLLWYGSSEDITERKASQDEVARLAYCDSLTGLPNRARFGDLLSRQVANARHDGTSFALHSLDLDVFKAVNDRLGHPAGDAVLLQIADRLKTCLQGSDVLARCGSDEFFILQVDRDQPGAAERLTDRVAAALSEPVTVEGHVFSMTASIGVACYPQHGGDSDDLLRNADLALSRAKASGLATSCFFEKTIDEKQRLRLALKLDLRDALQKDEFELVYQPLIGLRSGQVEGFEALLRWRHPVLGWVSPAEFIPCAEETGLIAAIGAWVLEHACTEAAGWPGALRVAVNLSPAEFWGRDLPAIVAAALATSGLPADRLELEITESVQLLENASNIGMLHTLRKTGIRISLDDFGTGYSSLNYLQQFPFDKVKIDRSLICRLSESAGGLAVVRAVIAMCRALGMSITAEGVETTEQFEQLRLESCDQVQGYLISRPVPQSEVLALIERMNESADATSQFERTLQNAG